VQPCSRRGSVSAVAEPVYAALAAERRTTMATMAVEAKKLDVTLEPAITVFTDELHERHGTRPLTDQEFDELFGHPPSDGEAERWPRRANKRLGGPTRRC
jgi:hypothetical protein